MPDRDELRALAGRLVMVGVRGAHAEDDLLESDLDACAQAGVRSIILFDRDAATGGKRNIIDPAQTRTLIAHIRKRLGLNTILAVDQEGGAVARLKESAGFAPSISAAAYARLDPEGRRRAATRLARDVAETGFDLNFAPCVDLAIEPNNPIIAQMERAFSDDPQVVIACASEVIEAHARANAATCLKHFPGHGSSTGDTHLDLVDITDSFDAARELAPYAALLREAAAKSLPVCVMTAHVIDRSIDPHRPASLSPAHIDRLRTALQFDGPVITDSLDMAAVSSACSISDAASLALQAGADMILDCNNAPGPARECPAQMLVDRIVEDVEAGVIAGGLERLRVSAARIDRLTQRREVD